MTAAEKSAEMDRKISAMSKEDRDKVNAIASKIVDAMVGQDGKTAFVALSSVYWTMLAELDKPGRN